MEHYAGIDVSLESASLCVVDATGRIVHEGKVASEPETLIGWFRDLEFAVTRIGLEAGPLSQWLYAAMRDAGLAVELLETRHVRNAFKAMPVKTDRKDARGIAQLMRLGWFRPVHCKSLPAQEVRALLTARKLLQIKNHDVEMSLRGVLRGFGLKVGPTTPRTFPGRIRELVADHTTLSTVAEALLAARSTRCAWLPAGACARQRSRSPASSLWCCTACWPTGRASTPVKLRLLQPTNRRRLQVRAVRKDRSAQSKVPSPGRWIRPGRLPFSRASLLRVVRLADLLLIRPHQVAAKRRPRTEERHRRQDHGSEGLTNWRP